jgi:hypothetical protein
MAMGARAVWLADRLACMKSLDFSIAPAKVQAWNQFIPAKRGLEPAGLVNFRRSSTRQ